MSIGYGIRNLAETNERSRDRARGKIGSFTKKFSFAGLRGPKFSQAQKFLIGDCHFRKGGIMKERTNIRELEADDGLMKIMDISAITVNSATLEKIIGVSDRMIRYLAEEGVIVRASKGRYKLMASLTNYILNLKVDMEAKGVAVQEGDISLEEEKAMHERVKRHISELKLQIMKGDLHKSADVERVMTDMLVSVKTKLLSMPAKLAPILVSHNDIDYIRTALSREVFEALNELKDYNPKDFYSDEYVGDEEEYESTD